MSDTGCLLGFPNRIDESSLTGGSWSVGLPLANLKTRLLGQVARTANALEASTTFTTDFSINKPVRVLALVNHNLSLDALVRFRASSEGSGTNLMTYSEDFTQWSKENLLITSNSLTAPDGLVAMDTMVASAVLGSHSVYRNSGSLAAGTYTMSVYVKAGTHTRCVLKQSMIDPAMAYFDLTAMTAAPVIGSGATASITSIGGGVFRISLKYTTNSSYANVMQLALCDSLGNLEFTGDGTAGMYVWGAQLEIGIAASSYYPTVATSATRPAGYMDNWQTYGYDSGFLQAYPAVYPVDGLDWESDNFWSATYTQEEIEGYTTNTINILPTVVSASRWKVEIKDSGNVAGFIQIGRMFIGPAWQPERDAEVGLSMGWETNTLQQKAISGTKYYQRRKPYRVTNFQLSVMGEDEYMSRAFEIDKMAGIDKEVLYIYSAIDSIHAIRRRYLGTIRQLTPIECFAVGYGRKAYTIEEIL